MNLLIAATSILAFIAGDSDIKDDNTCITTWIGCLAAFSVFLNSCDSLLGYKSRADMHTGAKLACKELLTKIDFELIKYVTHEGQKRATFLDGKPMDDGKQVLFVEITTKFQQVQESCTSPIPDPISQAFRKMNHFVVFDLGCDIDSQGVPEVTGTEVTDTEIYSQIVRMANVLLCDEITKSSMWPMKLPGAAIFNSAGDNAMKKALAKVRAGKRVRAGGLEDVLAAAAPAAAAPQPLTATSYHPAALAAADPNRRFA